MIHSQFGNSVAHNSTNASLEDLKLPGTTLRSDLLQRLIRARAPSGQEDEVALICQKELERVCDEVTTDMCGNVIGVIKGDSQSSGHTSVRLMTHMDEISMIVKRVTPEGNLVLRPIGGVYPSVLGQGPVEILGDGRILDGILSMGSIHVTSESKLPEALPTMHPWSGNKAMTWDHVYVRTDLSAEELVAEGVHPGSRVVIHHQRRNIQQIGSLISSYFLDNRAGILVALKVAEMLRIDGKRPPADRIFVMSVGEEESLRNSSRLNRELPGDISVTVDVGPVAAEYTTILNEKPIVVYKDRIGSYNLKLCKELMASSRSLAIPTQQAIWESYWSDSTESARGALLCFPTDNTHGFEITDPRSLENCAHILAHFLGKSL